MPLRYDFDMVPVFGAEITSDPRFRALMKGTPIQAHSPANYVALFRDPATVKALRAAPEPVQELFLNSGFGMNTPDPDAPFGYYRASHDALRTHFMNRMNQTLEKGFDGARFKDEPFNLGDFLGDLIHAQPLADNVLDELHAQRAHNRQKRQRRRSVLLNALRLLGVGLLVAAYIAVQR